MPPKRRKISTGAEGENYEGDPPSDRDWITMQDNVSTGECMEIDATNQGPLATSPEGKSKDDTLKPTRISKRLIIKRNKFVDEEDLKGKTLAKPVRQTTPRKPRSSASARQTKQSVDSAKTKGQKVYGYWSLADKRTFFLGLQQYGKNFEAISKKISQSARVKGFAPKDKVQVQYFYYRNWRKIAKFVDMKATDVPMKTQELYGLINYGVLNKYVKENDPSFGECLNNLIHHGETTFMRKYSKDNRKSRCGKLRTPVCTCLKKINRLIDVNSSQSASSQKIPQAISIELTPRSSKAWAKVQSVSQNPRLRMKVPASRTLESVIKFLSKKWKPQRIKNKEKFGMAEESKENLVMFLHPNTKIFPVTLLARQNEKVDVTFSNYRQNVLPMLQSEKKTQASKGGDKTSGTEKEKEKLTIESNPEQGHINSTGIQDGVFPCSDSSHSQKSEEKLSLFIPDNKCHEGGFPLQEAEKSPSETELFSLKTLPCMSPTLSTKDRPTNSPKALYPTSVLLDDDNAMFPDSSEPFSPTSLSSSLSSSLQQSKSQQDACLSPLIMHRQGSPGLSADITSPSLGRKKRVGSRNTKKTDGTTALVLEPSTSSSLVSGGDNNSTSSTSPAKQQDCPGPPPSGQQDQSPHKDSQQEISRLTRLATEEGFTALNSHTVTLLHLSLLLGRETLVRLQYEWREKRPARGVAAPSIAGVAAVGGVMQIPPLLGQAAGQMSNLLRRLCNLATLELTDFVRDTTSKTSVGASCSRCSTQASTTSSSSSAASAPAKGSITRTRRQSLLNNTERQSERSQDEADSLSTTAMIETKDMGIQTDPQATAIPFPFPGLPPPNVHLSPAPGVPATVRLPGNVQVLQQGSVVTTGGRTFVAGTPPSGAQVNGGDQVFRVPLIPTFRDAARVEQMKQEQQRRLQETAKNILEQGSNQRKLLKRRRVINKKKKEPPVIVQRTLMPKLDAGEVVTYIQQPAIASGGNTVLYSLNPAEPLVPHTAAPHPVPLSTTNSLVPAVGLPKQDQIKSVTVNQLQKGNDILKQAALDAEIDLAQSPAKSNANNQAVLSSEDESDETITFGPKPLSEDLATTRSEGKLSGNTNTSSSPNMQMSMNADISMSDFDISLTGVPVSNMGPDAGDKFLDLVLQNSEQGFSGLLNTPKKLTSASSTLALFTSSSSPVSTTTYDSRILRTPTHFGTSAPIGLITPVKLNLDQEWGGPLAVGDISLSNILDDSSSFKTNSEQKSPVSGPSSILPIQVDMTSNDGFMKHNDVADLSLSSLLGDPSFKKDDDSTCGLSPPLSSASLATSLPSLVSISGPSSVASQATSAGKGKGGEEGRVSVPLFSEVSRDSFTTKLDVESSLHSIMVSETSLDLVSKFEAMAGAVTPANGSQNLTNIQNMPETLVEDVTMASLTVNCREEAVDSHTVKLESPSSAS